MLLVSWCLFHGNPLLQFNRIELCHLWDIAERKECDSVIEDIATHILLILGSLIMGGSQLPCHKDAQAALYENGQWPPDQ